jgi:hypothetical protein
VHGLLQRVWVCANQGGDSAIACALRITMTDNIVHDMVCNTSLQLGNHGWKGNGTVNVNLMEAENVGMVHAFLKSAFTCYLNHTLMPAPFSLMPYFCSFDQSLYAWLLLLCIGQCVILHNKCHYV